MKKQSVRKSNYGIKEKVVNLFYLIGSKIIIPHSRLIRFPIVIRGRKWIEFGHNLTTGRRCRIEVNGVFKKKALRFGNNVNIGDDVRISVAESVSIGNDVLMGSKVLVIDNSHGKYSGRVQDSPEIPPNQRGIYTSPVIIEDKAWIGEGAVIQMGVTVGYGSVVCANSVVTKSVEPKTMVGGIPAKPIKQYNDTLKKWERV